MSNPRAARIWLPAEGRPGKHLFHPPVLLPEWPSPDHCTRMVFITRDLQREAIEATLAAFEDAVSEA